MEKIPLLLLKSLCVAPKLEDRVKLHVMPNVMCVGYALMHMQESDRHVVLFNSLLIPKACAILSDASGMHTQNTNL